VVVLKEFDQLLQYLPDQKIREFARSDTFDHYKRLFESLMSLPVEKKTGPDGEVPDELKEV